MTSKMYEPMLWKSYSVEDRIAFLVEECNCLQSVAEDYAGREFASLPFKIRESVEALEHFD